MAFPDEINMWERKESKMTIEGIDPYSPVIPQVVPPPTETNPAPENEVIKEEGTGENVDTSA